MKIGVPKETAEGERRVALVPDVVKSLKRNEHLDVLVERGAGEAAGHPDAAYEEAGAELVDGRGRLGRRRRPPRRRAERRGDRQAERRARS